MIYTIIILTLSSSGFPATLASLETLKSIFLQKLLHYLLLLTFLSQPLTFLSVSTQLFKTNGNLVGIYTPNNKLYKIYPNVSTLPPLPNTFTRKEQTTLNKLLIGHSRLTHSYLINKDPVPTCEHCKCIVTIEHILCRYLHYI